ncbi:MAG: GIY-YIG nuclease family protein [Clostridium sp.]|uniref:GIY-YIG nuclease family protein n=1 Tax=Clostridium sp. TaxID=1506 RepID=UPI002FCC1ADF
MNFIYILKCSDNTLYTGWTTDLNRRLKTHLSGKASKYTRARLPVEMVYSESFLTKSEAMKREAAIKKLTRKEKLNLISKSK